MPSAAASDRSGDGVLVVVAGFDPAAHALAERLAPDRVRVLTPLDLSTPGWCYRAGMATESRAIVAGVPLAAGSIRGILTRLPGVSEHHLTWIEEEDRAYVAAEMQAFLLAWLTELPCPVLNRPSASCLAGPFWRHEQWVQAAATLGMAVRPVHRADDDLARVHGGAELSSPATRVTVVGHRHVGTVAPALANRAHGLARRAGVELLEAWFDGCDEGAVFLGATTWPDLTDEAVLAAVRCYFAGEDAA